MSNTAKPFLKWVGGKRWLVQNYGSYFSQSFSRFVEPFVGSGAIFFSLSPKTAWINDLNSELISTYNQIKSDWRPVVRLLKKYQRLHDHEFYYQRRDSAAKDEVELAARFIYLNRTCFNGIYRVNLKGVFNVPKGSKDSVLLSDDDFESVAKALSKTKITSSDFEAVINRCGKGDLVFLDPPYTVNHNLNGFLKYNERLFSWEDQVRLRDAAFRAKSRGSTVLVSNADHTSIHDLYRDSADIRIVERNSVVAASSSKRKKTTELLIVV